MWLLKRRQRVERLMDGSCAEETAIGNPRRGADMVRQITACKVCVGEGAF